MRLTGGVKMKYKNKSEKELVFRAYNSKMEKVVFRVKPGDVIEVGSPVKFGGMEKEKEKTKTNRGGK